MAFLNDIGKKLSDAGQNAVQKTKELADIAKLTSQISDEEKSIKVNYALIGERYYEETKDHPTEAYVQYMDQITEAKNRISDYQNKIDELRGRGKCPNCGATIASEDLFCASCGHKIEKKESQPESDELVCPKCGNRLTVGAAFCIHCGTKVEETLSVSETDVQVEEEKTDDTQPETVKEN